MHFIFGIQLEGTLELRPRKLAQIYLRGPDGDGGVGQFRNGKLEWEYDVYIYIGYILYIYIL